MRLIKSTFLAVAGALLLSPACMYAGNIPQYAYRQFDSEFVRLTNATPVACEYHEGDELIFAGDRAQTNAYSGQGYNIGFDFRYAGRTFNQFAIDNNGALMLGRDRVEYRGYSNLFFKDPTIYTNNSFYLGLMPAKGGIQSGDISYKTEGTPGQRVLTVEFDNMTLRKNTVRDAGAYALQIALHEADGRVEFRFLEIETPVTQNGFFGGISGWDMTDRQLLTGTGIGDGISVSDKRGADLLDPASFIKWREDDELGYEHDTAYSYTLEFTPTGTGDFTCGRPGNLMLTQAGDKLRISCERPENAPATAILISKSPFGAEDLPVQGMSYPVKNDAGEFATTLGNATLVCYNDDANPTAEVGDIEPSCEYYIKAIGVDGYPTYSFATSADATFISSHPAPLSLLAESAGEDIKLRWSTPDDILITETLERVNTYREGATGIFGIPEVDAAEGSEVEGGGRVIYNGTGASGEFVWTSAEPNVQHYFRAWAIKNGRLSETFINARGVTEGIFPFEPNVELYTLYETPQGWISNSSSDETTVVTVFTPRLHGENEDEPCVAGMSVNGTTATLISPSIPLGKNSKLSFEWAMETAKELPQIDPTAGPSVQLPEGNKPGEFGMGHKFVAGYGPRGLDNILFEAEEYTGTMKAIPTEPDKNISGTSEFLPVEVAIPEEGVSKKIGFRFSTQGFSTLFLRNIRVTGESSNVETMGAASEKVEAVEGMGLMITSRLGGSYDVYSLEGVHVASVELKAGEYALIPLPKGIYVAAGRKIVVK